MPMHLGTREARAEEFVTLAQTKYPKTSFWYPLKQGDNFLYKNGDILLLKWSWIKGISFLIILGFESNLFNLHFP